MMSCTIDFADPNSEEALVEKALEDTIDKLGNIDNYDGYSMMKTEINYDEYIEREYINIYVNRYATKIKMASVITEDGEIIKQQVFIFDTTEVRGSYDIKFMNTSGVPITVKNEELKDYYVYDVKCTEAYKKNYAAGDWVIPDSTVGTETPKLLKINRSTVYWGNLELFRGDYYLEGNSDTFERALDIYKAL